MNETGITTIRNVKLENVNIIGGRGTGSLVGRVTGNQNTRIENCSVNLGVVRGDGVTGGLVGSNNSYMTNSAAAESFRPVIYMCSANVSVSLCEGAEGNKDKFGGLAGCNQKGLISNCFAHGSVKVDGGTRVGGLAGCVELRGIIINSYSTGIVSGTGTSLMGGFLGMTGTGSNLGTTINCYWDKTTSGIESSAAGIGLTTAEMKSENSFNDWDFEESGKFRKGKVIQSLTTNRLLLISGCGIFLLQIITGLKVQIGMISRKHLFIWPKF
jgi:trimeric autotransporter adhesin